MIEMLHRKTQQIRDVVCDFLGVLRISEQALNPEVFHQLFGEIWIHILSEAIDDGNTRPFPLLTDLAQEGFGAAGKPSMVEQEEFPRLAGDAVLCLRLRPSRLNGHIENLSKERDNARRRAHRQDTRLR
jgi:hypothetical protein